MDPLKRHWTEDSADDFLYKIAADFALQIENYLDREQISQASLAEKLNVTPARVSQVLNNPGNLSLKVIVEYVRALGKKVAIVAYDDGDAANASGPVNAQVFERCWVRNGRPADFLALDDADAGRAYFTLAPDVPLAIVPTTSKGNIDNLSSEPSESAGTDADKVRILPTIGPPGATNG